MPHSLRFIARIERSAQVLVQSGEERGVAYKGDPFAKRVLRQMFAALGYKVVRLKPYERRQPVARRAAADSGKIFSIGFNKTGTTTLEAVLRDLGYRMPKQLEQESLLMPMMEAKGYDRLRGFVAEYDAFQDQPFSQAQAYVVADALFPNSKFILTVRAPEAWVESYIRYYQREFGLEGHGPFSEASFKGKRQYLEKDYVYRLMRRLLVEAQNGEPVVRWDLAFDRAFLIAAYQRRNAEIRAYFAHRSEDFMELDLSQEADTGRLLAFLGRADVAAVPYPRVNRG